MKEYDAYPPADAGSEELNESNYLDWACRRLTAPDPVIAVDCGWCHRRLDYTPPDTCVLPVVGELWLAGTGTCKRSECQERTWRNIFVYKNGPKLYPGVPVQVLRHNPKMIFDYLNRKV